MTGADNITTPITKFASLQTAGRQKSNEGPNSITESLLGCQCCAKRWAAVWPGTEDARPGPAPPSPQPLRALSPPGAEKLSGASLSASTTHSQHFQLKLENRKHKLTFLSFHLGFSHEKTRNFSSKNCAKHFAKLYGVSAGENEKIKIIFTYPISSRVPLWRKVCKFD